MDVVARKINPVCLSGEESLILPFLIFQLSCKLFVLEKGTQSWSERGRGILRLNDLATGNRGELQSRIGESLACAVPRPTSRCMCSS